MQPRGVLCTCGRSACPVLYCEAEVELANPTAAALLHCGTRLCCSSSACFGFCLR